jgi:hypothetical protein
VVSAASGVRSPYGAPRTLPTSRTTVVGRRARYYVQYLNTLYSPTRSICLPRRVASHALSPLPARRTIRLMPSGLWRRLAMISFGVEPLMFEVVACGPRVNAPSTLPHVPRSSNASSHPNLLSPLLPLNPYHPLYLSIINFNTTLFSLPSPTYHLLITLSNTLIPQLSLPSTILPHSYSYPYYTSITFTPLISP